MGAFCQISQKTLIRQKNKKKLECLYDRYEGRPH